MAKWLDKYDAPQAQNGIEGTMGGLTDVGFNYNGAWGGPSMQMGGNIMPAMAGANQTVPMAQKGTRQPIYTSDPQDPRLRAYQDSLSLHNLGKKYFRDTYSHLAGYSTPKLDVWLDDQSDYQKRKDLKYYTIPEGTFELPWWKSDQKGTSLGRLFNSMANKALSTNILPIGGYYGEGYYPAFKKPVQPVEYKKRVLEKPNLSVELPKNIKTKERPQPKTDRKGAAPEPKTISDTPTKYSYTYPTGKYNEQKTIYFPSKSTWKSFVDQYDGLNTTERAGSFEASPSTYTRLGRPNPVFKNLKFQMGGVLPGAVGFTYARTAGAAPANGPYAKKTKASAQNGTEQSLTQPSVDWFKQWYQQRQALPQFSRVAGKRLELLSAPPKVELTPIEELQKIGAVAEYKRVRSADPSQDILSLADPATIPAYAERLQKERGKPFQRPVDTNLGTHSSVVGHEVSHWLDARAPQSTFKPRGARRSDPYEKYPIFNAANLKESGLDKSTYRWISNSRLTPIPGVRTELNSVLNELRQREGLRGDQPTTPEQMKGIMDKYMNLSEDQLFNQTIEGSQNDRIRTLIKYLGKDPAKLSELNNRIVAAPKKQTPTAQNGQEMKFYQEGLDFTPKTISKNGGWLDKYDAPQAQDGDVLEYLKKGKSAPVVTKGKPLTAEQQKRITAETLKRQTQKSKPLAQLSAKQIKQQQYDLKQKAEDEVLARDRRIEEEEERARIAEGKAAEATRENPNVPFTFPTGESKLWKDMDWREKQYVSGRNLGSMSRSNNWTDWINPLTMIGEMGEGLSTAPYMARVTDSNLPYVAGVASPLLAGALGGLGTRNTGQFANNMLNPVAGMDLSFNKIGEKVTNAILSPFSKSTQSAIKSFGLGLDRGIADVLSGRPISETFPITKKQIELAKQKATQEHAQGSKFARDWYYDSKGAIRPEVEKKIESILKSKGAPLENYSYYPNYKTSGTSSYKSTDPITGIDSYHFITNPFANSPDIVVGSSTKSILESGLPDDAKKYLLEKRHKIGGVNFVNAYGSGPSMTLFGHGPHYYRPRYVGDIGAHEAGHTAQNLGGIPYDPRTGAPYYNYKTDTWGEVLASTSPDYDYYIPNPNTEIGQRFGKAMIEPEKGKYTWAASPNELHSELMMARLRTHKNLMKQGLDYQTAIDKLQKETVTDDAMVDELIRQGGLNRFFKKDTPIEEKRALIRLLPAAVPAVGAASMLGGESEESPKRAFQDGGGIPVDPMGYWNPENVGSPVIIPSNIITMEGVDQPLIGISDTGDIQYMEPGEDYEFDGEYVTEYPIAQEGYNLPTAKDSLNLYNRSLQVQDYYRKKDYERKPGVPSPSEIISQYNDFVGYLERLRKQGDPNAAKDIAFEKKALPQKLAKAKEYQRNARAKSFPNYKEELKKSREAFAKANVVGTRHRTTAGTVKQGAIPFSQYYRKTGPNQFEQRESSFGFLDLNSPMQLYDERIVPQHYFAYHSPERVSMPADVVEMYAYDPLAVKPYAMRTEKEKVEWERKYGQSNRRPKIETKKEQISTTKTPAATTTPTTTKAPARTINAPSGTKGVFGPNRQRIGEYDADTNTFYADYEGVYGKTSDVGKSAQEFIRNREQLEQYIFERTGKKPKIKSLSGEEKKQRNGGVNNADAQPLKKLDQLLNFTNYNKPTKGGWLDKYN